MACNDSAPLTTASRRRGFALLKTVAALALVAALLQMLCLRSLDAAASATHAEHACQRRWASATLRMSLLPNAQRLLQSEAGTQASRRITVKLGGLRAEAILSDEQAKVNLNEMIKLVGSEDAMELIRQAATEDRVAIAHNAQLPTVDMSENAHPHTAPPQPITDWRQLFPEMGSQELLATIGQGGIADRFTLWGSGKLNVQATSRASLLAFAGHVLEEREIDETLRLRSDDPNRHPYRLLRAVGISGDDADELEDSMTNRSQCHSLLLRISGSGPSNRELTIWQRDALRPDGCDAATRRWVRSSTQRWVWE